jgi:hypothetical protein
VAGDEGEEEEEEGPREGRRVPADGGSASWRERNGGDRRRGWIEEETPGARSRERRETTGRRRHESGGGEGSAWGKWGARVAASRACGLPNDGKNWPKDKFHVVGRSGEKGRIPGGLWAPKGALKDEVRAQIRTPLELPLAPSSGVVI